MSDFDPWRARSAALFAHNAFYRAFADGNYEGMSALWARTLPVLCLHPGWPALAGRAAVLDSWKRLLGGAAIRLDMSHVRIHFVGTVGFVSCCERVGGEWLAATNAFAQEDGDWRMVFHQAGSAPPPDAEPEIGDAEPRPN